MTDKNKIEKDVEKILQRVIDTMKILPNGNAKVSDKVVNELIQYICQLSGDKEKDK